MALSSLTNNPESDADYSRRECRVREAARRRGYRLTKSKSRNEAAVDYCRYAIGKDGWLAAGDYGGLDLDEVVIFLNQ